MFDFYLIFLLSLEACIGIELTDRRCEQWDKFLYLTHRWWWWCWQWS